jgi:transcriptional regulator with XRE-family HTH domain
MNGLFKLRKQKGLSQMDLALAIGVDNNSISRYERGIVKPTIEMAQKFAAFFNVSVDELLNGPTAEIFRVTLKFVKTLEGVNEEMQTNGIVLHMAQDGFVGVSGGKKLESHEDIELIIEEIRHYLTFGFENRDKLYNSLDKQGGKP